MKETVIQSVSIMFNGDSIEVEVGNDFMGAGVVEIVQVGFEQPEFHLIGDEENIIACIKASVNAVVIIGYKTIVIDGDTPKYFVSDELPF